uniref:Asteroid domain-containing protein n=1 Tax=Anopheles quadriannulatus TaxID=34691 RepID=A0A182XCH0_ANOQN
MGVRGLTTFIEKNAAVYLKPHELHDTNLVIDGDNLCVQLFKRSQKGGLALGGNYDAYYRTVVDFFDKLQLVNVIPYVLLDGGYESRKIAIVRYRMQQRILKMKGFHVPAINSATPPMLREVFVDAMRESGVAFMRCAFEADDEVAILARKLGCPVLSYDSDFYIHDVQYIPYVTLSSKVYRKVSDREGENFKVGIVERKQTKKARRRGDGVRYIAQCGDQDVVEGEGEVETYSYLDCCLYTIDNLTGPHDQLGKEMIPLFAVLLGNDYIERNVLRAFYEAINTGRVNRKINQQERRLKVILKWLQNHTFESATRAIIRHIKGEQKQQVYRQILTAIRGYNCEDCVALHYFGLQDQTTQETPLEDDEIEKDLQTRLGAIADGDETMEETVDEASFLDSEEEEEEEDAASNEGQKEKSKDDQEDELSRHNSCDEEHDKDENDLLQEESDAEEIIMDGHEPLIGPELKRNKFTDRNWPDWFKRIYSAAQVPRFLADLIHSNLYINYPQIEDVKRQDSNRLSGPILRTVFAILKTSFKVKTTEFKYVTRRVPGTGVVNAIVTDACLPAGVEYDPAKLPNVTILRKLFEAAGIEKCDELFETIRSVPSNLRLYFLAIIYWAKNCPDVNLAYVHALVVCILQLQIVDKALKSLNRNVDQFRQAHREYLEQQRQTSKTSEQSTAKPDVAFNRTFYNKLASGTSRASALLAYDHLIQHFSYKEEEVRGRRKMWIEAGTMHTLASFQSVCFNLYALTPLLGYPVENLRMHELYNTLFVYNVYERMKNRADLGEYERTVIFRHSPTLYAAVCMMVRFVETYVPELKGRTVRAKTGKAAKRKEQPVVHVQPITVRPANDWDEGKKDESSESDDGEGYVDVNNKFSQLLLAG